MVPPPIAMVEMIMEAWAAQAITTAADLGIADALAKGPLSAEDLAATVNADADAVSRLLRALIARGIFRQRRDGRYDLTPLADALRSDAEVSMAGMARWGVLVSTASIEPRPYFENTMSTTEYGLLRGRSSTAYLMVAMRMYSNTYFTTGPMTTRRTSFATCAWRLARASTCCLSNS
jgi:hypothetical protein